MIRAIQIVCPLESIAETQPPTPPGFAEIVSDDFPLLHAQRSITERPFHRTVSCQPFAVRVLDFTASIVAENRTSSICFPGSHSPMKERDVSFGAMCKKLTLNQTPVVTVIGKAFFDVGHSLKDQKSNRRSHL